VKTLPQTFTTKELTAAAQLSTIKEFLPKNNITAVHHPPYSLDLAPCHFSFSHYFETTDLIEAELRAELNTLTEHDFQDTFKNGRSARNSAYMPKGTTSRVVLTGGPKVTFLPESSTSARNCGE
jgi:hypothetical protein